MAASSKYEYKGKCLPMQKISAGTITKGDAKTPVVFYKTVHGSVYGYAKTTKGKTVAISKLSLELRQGDTLDQLFFQDLTYGRIHSFSDFAKSAAQTPQTFNSFYADASTAGVYTAGLLPIRPNGADSDLPTDGRGKYEWTGYLAAGGHPGHDPQRAAGQLEQQAGAEVLGLRRPLRRRDHAPALGDAAQQPPGDPAAHAGHGRRRHEQGGHPGRPW